LHLPIQFYNNLSNRRHCMSAISVQVRYGPQGYPELAGRRGLPDVGSLPVYSCVGRLVWPSIGSLLRAVSTRLTGCIHGGKSTFTADFQV